MDGVVVERGARVSGSVLGPGVRVGAEARVENVVLAVETAPRSG